MCTACVLWVYESSDRADAMRLLWNSSFNEFSRENEFFARVKRWDATSPTQTLFAPTDRPQPTLVMHQHHRHPIRNSRLCFEPATRRWLINECFNDKPLDQMLISNWSHCWRVNWSAGQLSQTKSLNWIIFVVGVFAIVRFYFVYGLIDCSLKLVSWICTLNRAKEVNTPRTSWAWTVSRWRRFSSIERLLCAARRP